ncbi:metal ABC transporter permease [Parafrankia sp. FMc6]|uniref:metal ABC transporter permease n=1 Tax=Parafrankia soli TaxID=2599596 RepID=UPI0034D79ECA
MSLWERMFVFDDYGELLSLLHNSIIAGAVLGVVCGVISVFVTYRDLAFAVHGVSELSFAGAAGFLLLGAHVVTGSLIGALLAALLIGLLGERARDRNSVIGVLMPFGLGLGVLFLALYKGRAANKFGLLTGQIVAVDASRLAVLSAIAAVVLAALAVLWRPLTFASLDPEVATARGVPLRLLGPAFMLLLGATVAAAIQIVGALLVLSVICTPGVAATMVTARRGLATALSVLFATVSTVGGILLALGGTLPISPYITTLSFAFYLGCRIFAAIRGVRSRRGHRSDRHEQTSLEDQPLARGPVTGPRLHPSAVGLHAPTETVIRTE